MIVLVLLKLRFPTLNMKAGTDIISIPDITLDNTSFISIDTKCRVNKMTTISAVDHSRIDIFSNTTLGCKKRCEGSIIKAKDSARIVIGKNCRIDHNVRCSAEGGEILIGDNVAIGANTIITSHKKIIIGSNTSIASGCVIVDHDHNYCANGKYNGFSAGEVFIGQNVWIGANSIILKKTTIGSGAIIAAGTVLKGSIPDCCKVIQKRVSQIEKL